MSIIIVCIMCLPAWLLTIPHYQHTIGGAKSPPNVTFVHPGAIAEYTGK